MKRSKTTKVITNEQLAAWQAKNPLRQWRGEKSLGVRDAAAVIGCNWTNINIWESGAGTPRDESFGKVAAAMDISPVKLRAQWAEWKAKRPA